jgi:hypothetical protein
MLDLGTVEADPKKLNEGSYFEIWREPDASINGRPISEPQADKAWVLVVPFGIAYERALDDARRPFAERLRTKTVTDDDLRKIQGQALARSTFRGCGNISMRGEAVVWSEAKAVELMTDERWIRLREFVMWAASNRAASAAREEEEAKGN